MDWQLELSDRMIQFDAGLTDVLIHEREKRHFVKRRRRMQLRRPAVGAGFLILSVERDVYICIDFSFFVDGKNGCVSHTHLPDN